MVRRRTFSSTAPLGFIGSALRPSKQPTKQSHVGNPLLVCIAANLLLVGGYRLLDFDPIDAALSARSDLVIYFANGGGQLLQMLRRIDAI